MKNKVIVEEIVYRQQAGEALRKALLEWETKMTLPAPNGFLKAKASDKDPKPQDKAAWLMQRVAEFLEK